MAARRGLQVVHGAAALESRATVGDPVAFQNECLDGFHASQVARGFSAITIENDTGVLERFLALTNKPVWELAAADLDRMIADLVDRGIGADTRRNYVSTFRQFFSYLQSRHASEIETVFEVRLHDPLDRFHAGRHVSSDSPATRPPPTPARMEEFFAFLRELMENARKWAPAARDYALFRTLYHSGLRAAEATTVEVRDLHFDRGPFGKIHVRLGKAARGSGPRPRWVPMLDDVSLILHWYLEEVRPRFRGAGPAAFCDEAGGFMHAGTVRNRLAHLLAREGRVGHERFSPHDLRRSCATRNYERGVDLVAIQQMLGHWNVGTTMRYVTPSSTFVEDAYRRAVTETLRTLGNEYDKEE